jgi:hypothetical protein
MLVLVGMRGSSCLIIALLATGACEDRLSHDTDRAAERVKNTSAHLRHEHDQLSDEVGDVTRKAIELEHVHRDFVYLRSLRVQSLELEHSVAASQPLIIMVLANAKPLVPAARKQLDENLVLFRQRLTQTRQSIEALQYVNASEWERRDDEVAREMAAMFLARDASWQALDPDLDDDDETFPQI